MNWFEHNRLLDRVGASIYKDVARYSWNVPHFDRMRAEKPGRPYWLIETAPNWSGGTRIWNIHHDSRGIRAMTWKSLLLGGSMVLYWQWRQHWAGQEMFHGTVVTAAGRWRPNREAFAELGRECARHGAWLLAHPPAPAAAAVVLSSEAEWAFSVAPLDGINYFDVWREHVYLPILRSHVWRDVIHESADFSRYRVLAVSCLPIMSGRTRERLRAWVEQGGRLLLGPLTGLWTGEFTVPRDREFGGLEELIGGESAVRFPVHLVEDRMRVVFADNSSFATRHWCEAFKPGAAKTLTLARYAGGYGDGLPAVLLNRLGRGAVLTMGALLEPAAFLALLRPLLAEAAIEPLAEGSGDVVIAPRASPGGAVAGYGIVNLAEEPRAVRLPAGGTDLLSGEACGPEVALAPLQVRLLKSA